MKSQHQKLVMTDNICRICFQSGVIKAVEKLPNGTAMVAVHDDGTEHKWLRYTSLSSIGYKKPKNPKVIVCPKCGKRGRLGEYHRRTRKIIMANRQEFYVVHERLEGYWGKYKKTRKRAKCYIRDPDQRNTILKRLGRIIS